MGNSTYNGVLVGYPATVYALAMNGTNNLFVGGSFSSVDGSSISTNYIASWNGNSWNILGSNSTNNGVSGTVNALAMNGTNNLFVGGLFSITLDGICSPFISSYVNNLEKTTTTSPSTTISNSPISQTTSSSSPSSFSSSTTVSTSNLMPISSQKYSIVGIILGIIFGLLGLLAIFGLIAYFVFQRKKKKASKISNDQIQLQNSTLKNHNKQEKTNNQQPYEDISSVIDKNSKNSSIKEEYNVFQKQEMKEFSNIPQSNEWFMLGQSNVSPSIYSEMSHIDVSELKFEKLIGSGSFGQVWKGDWRGLGVAIKQVKQNSIDEKGNFVLFSINIKSRSFLFENN